MDSKILLILACTVALASAWSYYPAPRRPMRFTRFAPAPPPHLRPHLHPHPHPGPHPGPHHRIPVPVESAELEEPSQHRPKRGHDDYDHDHDHDHGHRSTSGITGPVHTFVKTDKNANYKWGVRHHVGDKYAS